MSLSVATSPPSLAPRAAPVDAIGSPAARLVVAVVATLRALLIYGEASAICAAQQREGPPMSFGGPSGRLGGAGDVPNP